MNTIMTWSPREIKDFRTLLGVNQKVFADIVGTGRQQTSSVWETGKSKPSKISKILLNQAWEKFHRGELNFNKEK